MELFELYKDALNNAIDAIKELRENAEQIRDTMDGIIDSCETIEQEL